MFGVVLGVLWWYDLWILFLEEIVVELLDLVFVGMVFWFMVFAQRIVRDMERCGERCLACGGVFSEWFDVAAELAGADSQESFDLARARFEVMRRAAG